MHITDTGPGSQSDRTCGGGRLGNGLCADPDVRKCSKVFVARLIYTQHSLLPLRPAAVHGDIVV